MQDREPSRWNTLRALRAPKWWDGDRRNHIHQITDRGVELSLSLFLATGRVAEETRFREAINCEILQQAGALGMDIAPTYRKSLVEQAGERSRGDATARVPRAA